MNDRIALRTAIIAAVAAGSGAAAGFAAGASKIPLLLLVAGLVVVLGALAGWLSSRDLARSFATVREITSRIAQRSASDVPGPGRSIESNLRFLARRAEDNASEAEAGWARLRAVVEASDGPVLALDDQTCILMANSDALELFGQESIEPPGRPLIEVCRDHEIDDLAQATGRDRRPRSASVAFGAEQRPVLVTTRPIDGGGTWSVLLSLTDLEEFQRIDRVRRDFVANVSHELRTPLASIRAMAETIAADPTMEASVAAGFLERITDEVDRLANLTSDLLDLSRVESGAIEIHPAAEVVTDTLATAADAVRHLAEQAGVTIEIRSSTERPCTIDKAIVIRIVTNLLDNAVKFSPPGSRVLVDAELERSMLRICVADNGPGVPAADLARVFERFFKGDRSREAGGTGLGLAIVKHLAKIHGGSVSAESEEGVGTTFTVLLRELDAPAT